MMSVGFWKEISSLVGHKINQYLSFSPHVADIFSPLKPLGIIGFFYARMYPNGEFIDLTSNPAFAEHYFKSIFSEAYSPENIQDHLYIEDGVSLWGLNQDNTIHQEAKKYFSYGNGITLCENQPGYKEIYAFYSKSDQVEMSSFYLKHLDFLRKFKAYFVEKAAPIIEEVEKNKILMPELYRGNAVLSQGQGQNQNAKLFEILSGLVGMKTESLSSRELECLGLLAKGLSALEISEILKLSPRTVENYISNIKAKWNCSKTTELIYQAAKRGLV